MNRRGFTIVELLIVIVVIAILAAISVVAYNGIQERAIKSKVDQDISTLSRAIALARQIKSSTLSQITNSTATSGACTLKPAGTDLATLPRTDTCWVAYSNALAAISTASGMEVNSILDPWGRPYLIDENEGENGNCSKDSLVPYTQPFISGYYTISGYYFRNIPLSGFTGC